MANAILNLNDKYQNTIYTWWAQQSKDYFENLIECFKSVVAHIIIPFSVQKNSLNNVLVANQLNLKLALKILKILYNTNNPNVPNNIFAIPELVDLDGLANDYRNWMINYKVKI